MSLWAVNISTVGVLVYIPVFVTSCVDVSSCYVFPVVVLRPVTLSCLKSLASRLDWLHLVLVKLPLLPRVFVPVARLVWFPVCLVPALTQLKL